MTSLASTAATIPVRVKQVVRMASRTVSFCQMLSRLSQPSQQIRSSRHCFQMIRIHTLPYTAEMINFKALRDRIYQQFITKSMGVDVACPSAATPQKPITVDCYSLPKPTMALDVTKNLRPKAFGDSIGKHLNSLSGVMRPDVSASRSPYLNSFGRRVA